MAADAAPLVLVTSRSFGSGDADPEARLEAAGLSVVRGDPGHDAAALTPLLAAATAWIAGVAPVRAEHLDQAPQLRIVARYGTGLDSVDLDAARARGIVVTHTPGANAEAVADHTLAMLLAGLRHLVDADRAVRHGDATGRYVGRELTSLTVGLVGLGRVGQAVARRLVALGATVLGHDPAVGPQDAAELGVAWKDLDELLGASDIVSLHCPGGGPPVLDRDRLAAMRHGAFVVNNARHDVVDEVALAELLHEERLGGAAVDVVSGPDSPLLDAPRTILTPHVAGHTIEAVDRMGTMAAEDVLRVLSGEPAQHAVVP